MSEGEEDIDDDFLDQEEDDIEIIQDEENELHYSVEGLGQFHEIEGQKLFVKTDDCVHCIHDIQVALRKENGGENRKIDKLLGQWQTLEKRLVPLFLHYREDTKIWNGVLKLLVILTRPLSKSIQDIQIHLKFLQDYKESMNTQDMFITLMSILMDAVTINEQTDTQINEIQTSLIAEMNNTDSIFHHIPPTDIIEGETQQVLDHQKLIERKIRKEEKKQSMYSLIHPVDPPL